MGQPCGPHDINDTDAMQAPFAKQPRGGLDDDFSVEFGLLAGNTGHGWLTDIRG